MLCKLADLPDELPAEARNLLRRLYRLPERERNLVLHHAAELLALFEERLSYPELAPYSTSHEYPPWLVVRGATELP